MNWLNKRCLLIAAIFFVLPIFIYPVRGSIGHSITTYTYGFPFSWLSVHFTARGGRLFIWQALSSQPQGVQIDFITAILNFIILYVIIRALIIVFGRKKEKYRKNIIKKQIRSKKTTLLHCNKENPPGKPITGFLDGFFFYFYICAILVFASASSKICTSPVVPLTET